MHWRHEKPQKFLSSELLKKSSRLADEAGTLALLDIDMPGDAPGGSEIAQPRPQIGSLSSKP